HQKTRDTGPDRLFSILLFCTLTLLHQYDRLSQGKPSTHTTQLTNSANTDWFRASGDRARRHRDEFSPVRGGAANAGRQSALPNRAAGPSSAWNWRRGRPVGMRGPDSRAPALRWPPPAPFRPVWTRRPLGGALHFQKR